MKSSRILSFKTRCLMSSAVMVLMTSAGAHAAALPDDAAGAIAGQASPGRVQQNLDEQDLNPQLSPNIEIENLVLQDMPPNADKISFTLNSITLDGVNVYSQKQIESVYADKIGQTVTLADIYAISTALTNKYRNDGYILTQVIVPPQTIDGGDVQLRAVEGRIDQILVEGNDKVPAMNQIRAYANHVHDGGGALNVRELEKYLLLINDLPGVEARSILSPSQSQVGASDLRIIVMRDPFDAFLGVDNYGSRYLGPVQLSGAMAFNSYFGFNERLSAQLVVAPDHGAGRELTYFSFGYDQPIGSMGTVLHTVYSHTNTEPGYTLGEFDVLGRSEYISVALEHPFIRTRSKNFYGTAKLDMRDVVSKNNLEPTRHDTISALRLGGRFEFMDRLFGAGINSITTEVSEGLNIWGASNEGDPNLSRDNGDPTFTKVTFEAQRLQRLADKVNLLVAGRGQYADGPLLSSEEFGVGGIGLGRGYDPSEIVGDHGIAGKLEVQWNEPRPWKYTEDYQLFAFYDIGKVWNESSVTSSEKIDSLASIGMGARLDFMYNTKGGVAVAWPMTRTVETRGNTEPRVYFNLNKSF
jgi:hemolysin activation/secretion protein